MPAGTHRAQPSGQPAFRRHVGWSDLLVSWSSLHLFGLPRMGRTGCCPVEGSRAEGGEWHAS